MTNEVATRCVPREATPRLPMLFLQAQRSQLESSKGHKTKAVPWAGDRASREALSDVGIAAAPVVTQPASLPWTRALHRCALVLWQSHAGGLWLGIWKAGL